MEGRPARSGQTGSGPFRGPFTAEEYGRQLAAKVARVRALFPGVSVEVAPSPYLHHRHRGSFVVRDRRLGFWDADAQAFVPAAPTLGVFSERIRAAVAAAEQLLADAEDGEEDAAVLAHGLRSVEMHSTLSQELLVTFVYAALVDKRWGACAAAWAAGLGAGYLRPQALARWRKGLALADGSAAYVTEAFELGLAELPVLRLRQPAGSFSNPNAELEPETLRLLLHLVERACPRPRRVLELFCGNGNNILALAPLCEEAVGVELNSHLAEVALENIALNGLHGVARVMCMDAAHFSADACNTSSAARFDVVLVDPPRAGLDAASLELVRAAPAVCYVSCNADRLARDVHSLAASHVVAHFALHDHFPFTEHTECIALLRRREDAGGEPLQEESRE